MPTLEFTARLHGDSDDALLNAANAIAAGAESAFRGYSGCNRIEFSAPTLAGDGAAVIAKNRLAYLATPYTKYEAGIDAAFRDAATLAGLLMQAGMQVYSPIAHGHPIATVGKIDPLDLTVWLPFNELMVAKADVLIVALLPGWQESTGVQAEIAAFEKSGRPIYDLDPATLVMKRRDISNGVG